MYARDLLFTVLSIYSITRTSFIFDCAGYFFLVEKWTSCELNNKLKLPDPNLFIPKSLELKERDDNVSENGAIKCLNCVVKSRFIIEFD